MTGKRKARDDEPPAVITGREKKKQRTFTARAIPVGRNAGELPNSMTALPSSIDVEKFTEARAYEVNAMDQAMKSARANATQRVWQTLPRHLRRRAASHDFRRVPKKLWPKAKIELQGVKKKGAGRPRIAKLGKQRRLTKTEIFLHRQKDKDWLETHIWHAKRMKMENIWGYRLSTQPTEKAYRPSYRAAMNGSIIHDASYFAIIELSGKTGILKSILKTCCDPNGLGPAAARYTSGARALETHLYRPNAYPMKLIGPASIIWKAAAGAPASPKLKDMSKSEASSDVPASVWVRVHPAMYNQVWDTLRECVSLALDSLPPGANGEDVDMADLRSQFNVFEIMGPKSIQVVHGVLQFVAQNTSKEFRKVWAALRRQQTPGAAPRGMVLGFDVHDPRLSFPPKNVGPEEDDVGDGGPSKPASSLPVMISPSANLAASRIWNEDTRASLKTKRFKKSELDQRRSKQTIPGTQLRPLKEDNTIPGLIIQRTIGNMIEPAGSSPTTSMHGWTLFIPAGWGMPFWSSLIHTGTRVAGLRERRVQHFEVAGKPGVGASSTSASATPSFPEDYVSTLAYDAHADQRAARERSRWERTPPAKRFQYELAGAVKDVWKIRWDVRVLGAKDPATEMISTQPLPEGIQLDADIPVQPWLLRGSKQIVGALVTSDDAPTTLYDMITSQREKRGLGGQFLSKEELWRGALVSVDVRMTGRGAPEDLAVLYDVLDEKTAAIDMDTEMIPDPALIMGYITSANFSLSKGRGHGIGTVSLHKLVEGMRRSSTGNCITRVRNRDGLVCRLARLEPI